MLFSLGKLTDGIFYQAKLGPQDQSRVEMETEEQNYSALLKVEKFTFVPCQFWRWGSNGVFQNQEMIEIETHYVYTLIHRHTQTSENNEHVDLSRKICEKFVGVEMAEKIKQLCIISTLSCFPFHCNTPCPLPPAPLQE